MIHAVILSNFFFHFSPVNRTFRLIEFRIIELLLYNIRCSDNSETLVRMVYRPTKKAGHTTTSDVVITVKH